MLDATSQTELVHYAGFAPGEFPRDWFDAAYELHCQAWPTPWEGQLDRERFVAELLSDHLDALYTSDGSEIGSGGQLLAFVKWKATDRFYVSRDVLSDPALVSLPSAPPAGYVCAYEINATPDRRWHGLGRRLLTETLKRWDQTHAAAVYCTYSPKRKLTAALRQLARSTQDGRPALELFARRASAAAARRMDDWVTQLGRPLETFVREEIAAVPDERVIAHLAQLVERRGRDVIDGLIAAIGIAYNFVFSAASGQPACGPAAFHRALGAEHWRQYPTSATNCADALALVDHWRYSHDPTRRERCARNFKEQVASRAQPDGAPTQLLVLA